MNLQVLQTMDPNLIVGYDDTGVVRTVQDLINNPSTHIYNWTLSPGEVAAIQSSTTSSGTSNSGIATSDTVTVTVSDSSIDPAFWMPFAPPRRGLSQVELDKIKREYDASLKQHKLEVFRKQPCEVRDNMLSWLRMRRALSVVITASVAMPIELYESHSMQWFSNRISPLDMQDSIDAAARSALYDYPQDLPPYEDLLRAHVEQCAEEALTSAPQP
jgi:hypothetical protein